MHPYRSLKHFFDVLVANFGWKFAVQIGVMSPHNPHPCLSLPHRERIFLELMMSNRKLNASREGSK